MCSEEMRVLLSGHLDGSNTPAQEEKLLAHLEQCADCRRTLAEYQKMDAGISSLTQAPSEALLDGVMEAISKEAPKPKRQHRFPLRYGTAFAAVVAVAVLLVGTGKLSLSQTGSTAIDLDSFGTQEEATSAPQASAFFSTPVEGESHSVHANVDCAALAQAENCAVGVLYTEETLQILDSAPSLALSGAVRYTITQAQLEALALERDDLLIFAPPEPSPDGTAYLILIKPDA